MDTANGTHVTISESLHLSTRKLNIRKVLVTTDFSGLSEAAVKVAATLAQHFGSSLTVLHCVPPVSYTLGFETPGLDAFDVMHAMAHARMRDEVAIIPGVQSVEHRLIVETGAVVPAIQKLIDDHHIDLIVCASHGASGFEKAVLGSTAERILHHVNCPVLVVGPECLATTFQMGSIMLCTNLTPGSYRPAQYATSLAQEHNANLILVHAVPNHRYVLNTLLRSKLRIKLRELLPADIERWCHLKIVIVRGEAADSILPIAQREKASLIVAGISDEGVLADHLPWRTLTSLIRQAKCPVLAVRGHLAK